MKVLLFCCKGFEMMEFAPFYDVCGWAQSEYGYDVSIDVAGFSEMVKSAFWNNAIKVNTLIDAVSVDDYDALAIPGGDHLYGYFEEAYDERFLQLIREFDCKNKTIASICVAALPIGKAGVLEGRKATTYHLCGGYRQEELAGFGVDVINEPIVVDRNIITSYCPQTANDVAFLLLDSLIGREKTQVVKEGMGW